MSNEQKSQEQPQGQQQDQPQSQQGQQAAQGQQEATQEGSQQQDFDGLENKKPEELTPEELRLMADTMPGEGPGD